jgi:DNA processing protein
VTGSGDPTPSAVHVLALADLPGMGPARLRDLIARLGADDAWRAVCEGTEERPPTSSAAGPTSWQAAAARVDPARRWAQVRDAGIGVSWAGGPAWPARLGRDPQPPGAVFWRGRLELLEGPSVAVIGTRHATAEGRAVAYELGRDLTSAGLNVVSGLALGIDGAAHAGALERTGAPGAGAPIGVAASGVDVPYPRRHTELWARVAAAGVVISETPPGGAASTWRFPWRNRIIAALASLVVVVESKERGGSLLTADAALARGVDVGAVPGPVRSPVAAGCNQLLVDGAVLVRHAGDVLDALGRGAQWSAPEEAAAPLLGAEARAVLDAVGWQAASVGRVVERTGLPLGAVGRQLEELRELGLVTVSGGRWARSAPRDRRAR